jgi:hypothetical protein
MNIPPLHEGLFVEIPFFFAQDPCEVTNTDQGNTCIDDPWKSQKTREN